jgi:AcrR family transcriptional regulator
MAGTSNLRDGTSSRDIFYQSAKELFEEHGYRRTTMQQIADNAELHVQTLYRHFPSKSSLAKAIEVDRLQSAFLQKEGSTLERWRNLVERATLEVLDRPQGREKLLSFLSYDRKDPSLSAAWVEVSDVYQEELARGIAQDLGLDRYRHHLPVFIASMLWGGNRDAVFQWESTGGHSDLLPKMLGVIDKVEEIVEILVEDMLIEPGNGPNGSVRNSVSQ